MCSGDLRNGSSVDDDEEDKTQWHIEETLRGAISAPFYLQQRYSDRPLCQSAGEDDDGEDGQVLFCVRVLPSKSSGMSVCLTRHNEGEYKRDQMR